MKALSKRLRGVLAATISAALITSGALLGAPTAYAEDQATVSEAPAVEAATQEAPAGTESASEAADAADPEAGAPSVSASESTGTDATAADATGTDATGTQGEAATGTGADQSAQAPLAAPPAATPSIVATVTGASETGIDVRFDFANVAASTLPRPQNMGVYVALVETGSSTPIGSGQFVSNADITDGSGTGSYSIAAADLDRAKSYEAIAWYAHGNPTTEAMIARSAVTITAEQWELVFPSVWEPSFSVELADGTPLTRSDRVYKGDELVIRGTGFDPAANVGGRGMPIPKTLPQGSYVVFGKFAEEWQPSSGAASSTRKAGPQQWVLAESVLDQVPSNFQSAIRGQWVELAADGSWTARLTLADPKDAATVDGSYGVFTYGAGGVSNAAQELELRLEYVDSERPAEPEWEPAVQVFEADGETLLDSATPVYDGDEIVIRGTGFDPAANVGGRGMPIPKTLPQGSYVVLGSFLEDWRPSAGAASSTRKAGPQGWVLAESVLDQVPSNFQNAIRAQWVELAADGSWSATLTVAPIAGGPEGGRYGVYTYGAGGVSNADQELEFLLNYQGERPTWEPAWSVELANGTPLASGDRVYKGDEIVIRGTGFDPAANVGGRGMPIPNTLPQGSYVVFGKFGDVWQPSQGAASATRKAGPQGWVLAESVLDQVPSNFQNAIRGQWVELAADGSWTARLTLADPKDAATVDGSYGVFTYGAGGVNNAAQELELRLDYVDSERPAEPGEFAPAIKVFLADGTTPYTDQQLKEGDKLVVKGSGFDPYVNTCALGEITCPLGGVGNPIPNDKPQGTFVVFGHFAENWKPSEGADSSKRKMDTGNRGWALAADTLENDVPEAYREVIRPSWVELDPETGSFTWTVTLKEPKDLADGGSFGIYTYAGGVGSKNAAQELSVPLVFAGKDRPQEPEPGTSQGDLNWGVKESFRNYIEGGANGAITTLGQATRATDGTFDFVADGEAEWNAESGTGTLAYSGGVHFTGHNGGLSLTLENPTIEVQSATKAVLSARVNHGDVVPLADIDLSKATRTVEDGTATWSAAPAVLRAEGVSAFVSYPEGTALDPLTFSATAAPTPEGPAISADVVETANEKIDLQISGTGFDGVKALPGQRTPHVYLALIEKGIDLSTIGQGGSMPNTSVEVVDGAFSGTLTELAANLDRTKSYEVISWPSRSNPTAENIYARTDAVIDWAALFPKPPVQGSARLVSATSSGISVEGSLTDIDAASFPNGVKASVVVRGTSAGATTLLGGTVTSAVAADGRTTVSLSVARSQLDRSRQYEVVVWAEGATPTSSNLVKTLPFDISAAQWDAIFPTEVKPVPGAGSLDWGVSTQFADYINGNIAKGRVSTSGVGGGRGGYLFPQSTDSGWNAQTRTGSVQFRGSVNYWGHGGLIDMTFANPVITVTSPIAGSISAGGQSFPLNLAAARFTEHSDGSVTWSNVPVSGAISGGGNGGGGTVTMDPLTFTVGAVSSANFGSTVVTSPAAQKREAAATPPASTGVTVVTPAPKLIEGGEIEITASGFQPNETGILVVLYSTPTVLDDNAKADASGVVRWIGKLPKGLTGTHTITLQGSISVGQEITVLAADSAEKVKKNNAASAEGAEVQVAQAAEPNDGAPAWVWWVGALALLVAAGASTAMVVAQRRRNSENEARL